MGKMKEMDIDTPKKPPSALELIKEQLDKKKDDYEKMFPIPININHFIWTAYLAVVENQGLIKCTKVSLFTAIGNAAEVGLDFTPAKGHAYLIPYHNKKSGLLEAKFIPGYGGLIEVALRSGKVIKIEARLVYSNEDFHIQYGTNPKIDHIPLIKEKGNTIGAYAIGWMIGGLPLFEFMSKEQLDAIRKYAKTPKFWTDHEGEMQRKTAVRRLYKYLPSTPEMAKLVKFDNEAVGLIDIPFASQITDTGKSREDAILDDIKGEKETSPEEPQKEKIPSTLDILTGEIAQEVQEKKPTKKDTKKPEGDDLPF